jgi:hypothetical protein
MRMLFLQPALVSPTILRDFPPCACIGYDAEFLEGCRFGDLIIE